MFKKVAKNLKMHPAEVFYNLLILNQKGDLELEQAKQREFSEVKITLVK